VEDLDVVALKQLANIFGKIRHHLVLAGQHGRQIQGNLARLDAVFGKTVFGQVVVFGGIQQGFTGNAAHVEANPTQAGCLFHNSGL
jgi:hypothetical protein